MNHETPLASIYRGWEGYNTSLVNAIALLTPDQLAFRPAPGLRSVGETVSHLCAGRLNWFLRLQAPLSADLAKEVPKWVEDAHGNRYASEEGLPTDGASLVHWLTSTWQMIEVSLNDWNVADLERTYTHTYRGKTYAVSYQWTVWRILSHDIHHGGQLSLMLYLQGIEPPDLGLQGGHLTELPLAGEDRLLTPDEYLNRERKAEFRIEYRGNGVVVAMVGASRTHSIIKGNIVGLLYATLRGGPCTACISDMRVCLPEPLGYVYPDVVITCDEPNLQDQHRDILTNPKLVIEVLSNSTESYDRGEKWERYQKISSLREYVLVSQNQARVERFIRQENLWRYAPTAGIESTVTLESVGVSLRLAEIYEGVSLSIPTNP